MKDGGEFIGEGRDLQDPNRGRHPEALLWQEERWHAGGTQRH